MKLLSNNLSNLTNEIVELVNEFNLAKNSGKKTSYLNLLADKLQIANLKIYNQKNPFIDRRHRISEFEQTKWIRLRNYTSCNKNIKLFDSAFGSGRDLLIAAEQGYDVYGCELSQYFYNDFMQNTDIDSFKIACSDIRCIPFPTSYFDVIRHNASFLHMPLIDRGYTIHRALEESYRLLKEQGVLYIYTKEGSGFQAIDTDDGLGARSFQLFDENLIVNVLNECGFETLEINHFVRPRNNSVISWIEVFAKKHH